MTPRERVLAVLAGLTPDEKPLMIWPQEEMYSDITIVPAGRVNNHGSKARILLAEVLSPFSRAISRHINLNEILQEDPAKGEEILCGLVQETKSEIEAARNLGADGVFYRLQGAEPAYSTPMEYGGHYLEVDREILAPNTQHSTPNTQHPTPNTQSLNVLFVEGGPETYIDFVSDLPAAIFAWDCERTGIPVSAVRRLRKGALATSDREADILFGENFEACLIGSISNERQPGAIAKTTPPPPAGEVGELANREGGVRNDSEIRAKRDNKFAMRQAPKGNEAKRNRDRMSAEGTTSGREGGIKPLAPEGLFLRKGGEVAASNV